MEIMEENWRERASQIISPLSTAGRRQQPEPERGWMVSSWVAEMARAEKAERQTVSRTLRMNHLFINTFLIFVGLLV